jgi:hypothetical protein
MAGADVPYMMPSNFALCTVSVPLKVLSRNPAPFVLASRDAFARNCILEKFVFFFAPMLVSRRIGRNAASVLSLNLHLELGRFD